MLSDFMGQNESNQDSNKPKNSNKGKNTPQKAQNAEEPSLDNKENSMFTGLDVNSSSGAAVPNDQNQETKTNGTNEKTDAIGDDTAASSSMFAGLNIVEPEPSAFSFINESNSTDVIPSVSPSRMKLFQKQTNRIFKNQKSPATGKSEETNPNSTSKATTTPTKETKHRP